MRQFSPAVSTLLGLADVSHFQLVSIGDAHFTSLPYDVQLIGQSGITYRSVGLEVGLSSVEPPRLSSDVDSTPYKITLADPGFAMRDTVNGGMVGQKMVVRIGLINLTGSILNSNSVSYAAGAPLLHKDDTFVAYAGYISAVKYVVEFGEKRAYVVVEGASPMGDLDAVKAYYTSRDFAKTLVSSNTSYDKIYVGAGAISLKWGKG